jgi:hypothetical protein
VESGLWLAHQNWQQLSYYYHLQAIGAVAKSFG